MAESQNKSRIGKLKCPPNNRMQATRRSAPRPTGGQGWRGFRRMVGFSSTGAPSA